MEKPIIEINNLSKKYKIGKTMPYYSLRDDLANIFRKPKKILGIGNNNKLSNDEFWALKNVSFKVMPGEVIGIIGKNGAGKSTLLKIISRITPPTEGKVIIRGKLASLINVGAGFHPELTGRENIFLNGIILGMKSKEIRGKLAEIIDFAEIDKFIDTPVKYYSSGMYVRLAFAVASHLEPEILLIDEVLAVGDFGFQKKCLKRMGEIQKEGRTILLVSHDMTSIASLANGVILFEEGKTKGITTVDKGVDKYFQVQNSILSAHFAPSKIASDKNASIIEANIIDIRGKKSTQIPVFEPFYIEIIWRNNKGVPVTPNFAVDSQNGIKVMLATDTPLDWDGKKKIKKGIYVSRAKIPANLLNSNIYYVNLSLDTAIPFKKSYDNYKEALSFSVLDPMDERSIARGEFHHIRKEYALWSALEWTYKFL